MVELSEQPDCTLTHSFGGGSTLNTALYLARLALPVDYVSALQVNVIQPGSIDTGMAPIEEPVSDILKSAVPPLMVRTQNKPGGLAIEVFDALRKALVGNRALFLLDLPSGPFYG